MKNIFAFIMLVFGLALKAQPPKGDANSGDTYGEKVNAENAIWVSELPTLWKIRKYNGNNKREGN